MLSEYPDGDAPTLDQGADGLVWEEFDSIFQINPSEPTAQTRDIWSQLLQDPPQVDGVCTVSQSDPYSGSNCLLNTISSDQNANLYLQFYNYDKSVFEWRYLRETIHDASFLNIPGTWTNNFYNRMVFYVKPPSGLQEKTDGTYTSSLGTYFRGTGGSRSSAESGGGNHGYHRVNMPGTNGRWYKIIIDQHPSHIRDIGNTFDVGLYDNPTGEGINYFDSMTWFYYATAYFPQAEHQYFFDKFVLYNEANQENELQVYSISGYYDPSNNRLYVSWSRNADENDTVHEVRYSFQNIHDIGWDAANVAPNGTKTREGFGKYNTMRYDNDTISMGANTSIYVAVKPTDSNLFKQIQLDLT